MMKQQLLTIVATLGATVAGCALAHEPAAPATPHNPHAPAAAENVPAIPGVLTNVRQLTFAGKRSGEGYFSADGSKLIFQSERDADNPFYQIYLLDLETGDTERVSPGYGKTTCAWVHPNGETAMFASTHEDPAAREKMKQEIDFRASGQQRRYSWDYDEHYDIFEKHLKSGEMRNLTRAPGYDAEGSYSPDGKQIAFASNRHAYNSKLSAEDAEKFEHDKSYMMDIYIMDTDGRNVRRLTDAPGYDGGPFFSADGKKICWRRFSPDGATAEIFTMNTDGTDQRQITRMGAMSWAPYFHPSGEYLVFATNRHGFANFELYLVDAAGKKQPVRVTDSDGFDGLAAFSPDGRQLTWTSNRTADKASQIFITQWDDVAARQALKLAPAVARVAGETDAKPQAAGASAAITVEDLRRHIEYLASEELEGRLTGTKGEALATQYVADAFEQLVLKAAGDDGTYFQPFDFTAGINLGDDNRLAIELKGDKSTYEVDKAWRPLSFSQTGRIEPTEIVFAGYGIVAPPGGAGDKQEEYDSYVHTDVKGKWVMVLRFMPEDIPAARRQHLSRFAGIRYKAMIAREKGAAGIIVVSGPRSKVKSQLVPLSFDTSLAGSSLAAVSVTDDVAAQWMKAADKDLSALQQQLDTGEMVMGSELPGAKLGATIDIRQEKRTGRNVLARIHAGDKPAATAIVIGGHVDHLGRGHHTGSLAKEDEHPGIHYGADDNASGIAAMLEIAQWLADLKRQGKLEMDHDVIFAAWSGEELGLLGSSHFVRELPKETKIIAYLNMDMVGRYDETVTVHGMGSSPAWAALVEQSNAPVGLRINALADSYLPTDSTPFYVSGVPILSAFTGAHADYHKPTDTPEKINYEGTRQIAQFIGLVTRQLAQRDEPPTYIAQKRPTEGQRVGALRAYLGTIPDYSQGDVKGLKLSGVAQDGPADKSGIKAGDVVVEMAGRKIENIYDYTYAIEALKIGQPVDVVVQRGQERVKLSIMPESRQ